jgi:DNA-directed RNA polymerase specialized sigma24 family protein
MAPVRGCHSSRVSFEKQVTVLAGAKDDDALLGRFAAGEAEAFVAFYRRHLASILAFFLRRTGDPELTADLTAEVFAAALLSAHRSPRGWSA